MHVRQVNVLGPQHRDTLTTMGTLADLLHDEERHEDAAAMDAKLISVSQQHVYSYCSALVFCCTAAHLYCSGWSCIPYEEVCA